MKVTLDRHPTTNLGEIITIEKDGLPCARIRQIGKTCPDTRLEWITWNKNERIDHAIQFPCTSLSDITPENAEQMIRKYSL